jgi:predicted nucleic acid-binding protein
MIVIDASAITEFLLQTDLGMRVEERLYRHDAQLHAPHLIDVEVLSALRRLVHLGEVRARRAEEALEDLAMLRITRHGHLDLLTRAWQLRQNVTAYDAVYLALAEALGGTVVTCDGPFGAAPGHATRIEVVRLPA